MNGLASTGTWLSSSGWQTANWSCLSRCLSLRPWIDVREHRIPNALVFPGVASALLLAHLPGGSLFGSLVGIAVGLGHGLAAVLAARDGRR